MNANQKSMMDSLTACLALLSDRLWNVLTLSAAEGKGESRSTDPDFDGWVANDPMVTLNPASRYGDDATGFLAGSELDNPQLGTKDD